MVGIHADRPADEGGPHQRIDEGAELGATPGPGTLSHDGGEVLGGHDPSTLGILEVVTDIRDPIGPAHHLAFWGGGSWARP